MEGLEGRGGTATNLNSLPGTFKISDYMRDTLSILTTDLLLLLLKPAGYCIKKNSTLLF
jgi:hypothetical protein